jgi:hypothetical protein
MDSKCPKFAVTVNKYKGNFKERLTCGLESKLKGTFTRKIPQLLIVQCQTQTLFSPVSRSQPNARP